MLYTLSKLSKHRLKRGFSARVSAGALPFAIAASLLITILVGIWWVIMLNDRSVFNRYTQNRQAQFNVESGLELMQYGLIWDSTFTLTKVHLFENDSAWISHQRWGAFELLTSSSQGTDTLFQRQVLCGSYLPGKNTPALWVQDQGFPLIFSGKTFIKGDVLAPRAGIRRGWIQGQGFQGEDLVQGSIKTAPRFFTEPDQRLSILEPIQFLQELENQPTEWVNGFPWVLKRSFSLAPYLLHSSEEVYLDGIDYSGAVIIVSDKAIAVSSNTQLDNIILVAPSVFLLEGFQGRIQVLASDTIIVESACVLNYPSVLSLVQKVYKTAHPHIQIQPGANVQGLIMMNTASSKLSSGLLRIDPGAEVSGLVYCSTLTQHQGKINGSLITRSLYLKTPSSIYEYHLLSAIIDTSPKSASNAQPWAINTNTPVYLYPICRVH